MKIAVFLPNWLGDLVMATPALRAMRRHFGPDAEIVGIMRPYLRDLLAGTDWLSEQWYFNPRGKDRALGGRSLVRRMRERRFDMAVLLTNSLRTGILAWLGGARERIGYARYGRGPLLTGKLYPRREGRRVLEDPVVDTYLSLASAVGCPDESRQLELATTRADQQSAERIWQELDIRNDGQVIALNSSGAYGSAKLWPIEHFAQLARQINDRLHHDVLVMCGPKEREIARRVVKLSGSPRVYSMADQPMDLGTAKACIQRTRLMVSSDSGPRHVAVALYKPVVTLFGPILPTLSENPTQRAVNIVLDLDCIGCHKRVCPLKHHRCMRDITVDRVYGEVAKLIEEQRQARAA